MNCRPIIEIPEEKQNEEEEERWKWKVGVALSLRPSCHRSLAHVATSILSVIFPMEQVELLADLLGKHP